MDGAGRLPPVAEHSPAKCRQSLEPGQLQTSPVAAATPASKPAPVPAAVKAEPAEAGSACALPPGFAGGGISNLPSGSLGSGGLGASPDRQLSDTDLAADGQAGDGGAAPKRRRLSWGQGLARLRASPDAVQRKQKQKPAAEAPDSDAAAADDEPPAQQPAANGVNERPADGMAEVQAMPMENGGAGAQQPVAAPDAEPTEPQEALPSKLELMSTMEKVRHLLPQPCFLQTVCVVC